MRFIPTHKTLRINFLHAETITLNNSSHLRASFVSYLIIKHSLTIASVFSQACVAMVTVSVVKSQPCHQTLRSCPTLSVLFLFVRFAVILSPAKLEQVALLTMDKMAQWYTYTYIYKVLRTAFRNNRASALLWWSRSFCDTAHLANLILKKVTHSHVLRWRYRVSNQHFLWSTHWVGWEGERTCFFLLFL